MRAGERRGGGQVPHRDIGAGTPVPLDRRAGRRRRRRMASPPARSGRDGRARR